MKLKLRIAISLVFAIAMFSASAYAVTAAGAVYTESNSASGNSIKAYVRDEAGKLWPVMAAAFPTGGMGTGAGLGSQGALAIDDGNRFLFAVNAGSDSISVFKLTQVGVRLVEVAPSNGKMPISLTVKHNVLYVLNNGGAVNDVDTLAGFSVGADGHLTPIMSGLHLSANSVGPAQVSFDPDGNVLVVTEKMTNNIDVFTVDQNGMASGPMVYPSASPTPFGFAIGNRGQVFVSEAVGGMANLGVVSSYSVSRMGMLHTISGSVADNQTAPCWVVLSGDGRYAYTTNTGSGSVSSYAIGFDGTLQLLNPVAANVGASSSPLDAAISNDKRYMYFLTPGTSNIQGFAVATDGSLSPVNTVSAIPASAAGLVAR